MRGPRARRILGTVTALAAGTLLLAACGTSAAAPDGTAAAAAKPQTEAQLKAAAEKEGQVNWYTTFASDDVQPMVAAFNKIYPKIKVNALRLSADQIPHRIITEQRGGKYNADVVSGDSPQVAQLIHAGAMQPYMPAGPAAAAEGPDPAEGLRGHRLRRHDDDRLQPGGRCKQMGLPTADDVPGPDPAAVEGPVLHRPRRGQLVRRADQSMGHDKALEPAQGARRQRARCSCRATPGADPGAGGRARGRRDRVRLQGGQREEEDARPRWSSSTPTRCRPRSP